MRARGCVLSVAALLLLPSRASAAWDPATPAWCGSTVAATTDTGVALVTSGVARSITLGFAPKSLRFNADCSRLAAAGARVALVDVASSAVTDFGPTAPMTVTHPRISWSPSGQRFAVPFYGGRTRGADVVLVYDPMTRSNARLALPGGELDDFELLTNDSAVLSFKIGSIFGEDSLLLSSTVAWRALSSHTYKELYVRAGHAAATTSAGSLLAIEPSTGAERVIATGGPHLRGISADGTMILANVSAGAAAITRYPFSAGAAKAFGVETYDPAWSADGKVLAGVQHVRTGLAATHLVLYFDDGRAGVRLAYDAGAYGSKKISRLSVSPDGTRAAFIVTTTGTHHPVAVCGDWSWDERHELVVVQLGSTSPPAATFLATSLGCAYE